jgi:xanthine dehydrogenase YagT iron-sulfur-binding subunit
MPIAEVVNNLNEASGMGANENDSTEGLNNECGFLPLRRRDFLSSTVTTAVATTLLANSADALEKITQPESSAINSEPVYLRVKLRINGQPREFNLDARVTLLDALREYAGLTGTKKGCDRGQCGACTVLVNKRRINSCLTLAVMHNDDDIVTVEGLASGSVLHPLQQAFLQRDAFQCGYCTPGQICSGVAAIEELRRGDVSQATADFNRMTIENSAAEIRERMSGNLCRCGAYSNIVAAVRDVIDAEKSGGAHVAI